MKVVVSVLYMVKFYEIVVKLVLYGDEDFWSLLECGCIQSFFGIV